MAYDLRDEKGQLTLTISNSIANEIIQKTQGHFRPWYLKPEVTVFEVQKDMTYRLNDMVIYIWAGSLLIPKSE
jgi:hypothetical protein